MDDKNPNKQTQEETENKQPQKQELPPEEQPEAIEKEAKPKSKKEEEKKPKPKFSQEKEELSPIVTFFILILIIVFFGGLGGLYYWYNSNGGKFKTEASAETQVCIQNGVTFNDGASFDATDGCNTCRCSNGQVICTTDDCTKTTSTEAINDAIDTSGWNEFSSTELSVIEGTEGIPVTTTYDWIDFSFTDYFKVFSFKYPQNWVYQENDFFEEGDITFKVLDQGGVLVELSENQSCTEVLTTSDSWDELAIESNYTVLDKKEGTLSGTPYVLVRGKVDTYIPNDEGLEFYYSYAYCLDVDEKYSFFTTFFSKDQAEDNEKTYEAVLDSLEME